MEQTNVADFINREELMEQEQTTKQLDIEQAVKDILSTIEREREREIISLVKAFGEVKNATLRKKIIELIKTIE